MKYKVRKNAYLSWIIEKLPIDDNDLGEEYIVNYNFFENKFVCHCACSYLLNRECKHIRYIKQFITRGIDEFEE